MIANPEDKIGDREPKEHRKRPSCLQVVLMQGVIDTENTVLEAHELDCFSRVR